MNEYLKAKVERIIKYYNIDENLFYQKLNERLMFSSVEGIERQESYLLAIIKKMINEENLINSKVDDDDIPKYTIIDLINRLRSNGFEVNPDDPPKIENYIICLRKNKYMNCKQIRDFLDKSILYLVAKQRKTSKYLIDVFIRSKTTGDYLNGKINNKTMGVIQIS